MANISFNKNFNIGRVVRRIVYTVLALYVGGTIISTFGEIMNGTASPFYSGLSLIGWTVTTATNTSGTYAGNCAFDNCGTAANLTATDCPSVANCITDTGGSGVLAVIGVIGIASVVMEFISF